MPWIPDHLVPLAMVAPIPLLAIGLAIGMRRVRSGGPMRLAKLYPPVVPQTGSKPWRDRAVFGRGFFAMAWMRIGVDERHLHVRVSSSWQGTGAFSVPLEDITASPDRYGWMVLAPDTVRLRFARAPQELMMVFRRDFEKLAQASQGRLQLQPVPPPPPLPEERRNGLAAAPPRNS